ncbi:MAG TPA: DUF3962 domain-containing protein [Herpetosiphonaceae bacterium]
MAHEQIQPVAFHLVESSLTLPLRAMHFPYEWRGPLAALAGEGARADRPRSFRIASLNAAIAAFTPQLFVTPGQAHYSDRPWLIAAADVRPDKIWRIARAWLAEQYAEREDLATAYEASYAALQAEDLVWEDFTFVRNNDVHVNDTARIDTLTYAALPAFIADLLVRRQVAIPIQQTMRPLVRVPTTNGGAQLQTWPPVYYTEDNSGRRGAYSYTITITVQNLVGCSRPRIHMAYGIRRWRLLPLRTEESLYLPGREGRTVYLRHPRPLSGVAQSSHFTRAMLDAEFGQNQRVPVWRDALAGIASRIGAALPDPSELTSHPERYLEPMDEDTVIAAIVEKTPRNHPVKAGMGLEVREAITEAIAHPMDEVLTLIAPLERSDTTGKPQRNAAMLADDLRDLPAEERLQAVRDSIGPRVVVEVWWQTQEGRNQLIYGLHDMLTGPRPPLEEVGEPELPLSAPLAEQHTMFDTAAPSAPELSDLNKPRSKVTRKRATPEIPPIDPSMEHIIPLPDGGMIQVVPRALDTIGRMLPEPTEADQKHKGEYKRRETDRRAKEIQEALEPAAVPTLALIELQHFQDPRDRQRRRLVGLRDPKRALRLGMADTGRVTKFTTGKFHPDQQGKPQGRTRLTPAELLRERCDNAVLEGLRQMGYLPGRITVTPPDGHSLPEAMVVAGVRMLRLTRKWTETRIYLPVVTIFDTETAGVHAWLPDGQLGVRPFYQALLDITRMKDKDVSRFRQDEMLARLEQFLTEELPRSFHQDIVILAEAQNIRWLWPGLQNSEIALDALRFRKGSQAKPIDRMETRFRLIRLRTSERGETPLWYTENAAPGRDYASGLFRDGEAPRTFFNIATKPKTQGQPRRGKQHDPSEQYAIPSMLEILVAAQQPGDSDEAWALAVHTWRRMGYLSGGEMTLLPIPLQWAQRMDRYAAVIGPWVFREQEHLWMDDNDMSEEGDESGMEQRSLLEDEEEDES